jgi:hypothetical protein
MTTIYGLTDTGFVRKTYADIIRDIEAWQRDRISSKLDLSERTVLGNINAIVSEELAQAWETLEAAAGALDPDTAVEMLLIGLCKLTGVVRAGATAGKVAGVQLTFDRATGPIAIGALLLSVSGAAANLWSNDTEITAPADSVQTCAFTSVGTGSTYAAAADTLTTITTPILGLVAANNPIEAEPGTDVQSLDSLRTAREVSLAATGRGTVSAIAAAVRAVPGVIDARVFENDTAVTVGSLPPNSIRPVIWDGSGLAATNAALAAAIYAAKGDGTATSGGTAQGTPDPWGATKYMHFDRATAVNVYVSVTVVGGTPVAVKAALIAAHTETIDNDVLYASLVSAAFRTIGVTNVTTLTLGTTPAPGGTADIAITSDQVGLLDDSRIAVTIT